VSPSSFTYKKIIAFLRRGEKLSKILERVPSLREGSYLGGVRRERKFIFT
jgi:hypothetical protein